jgi:hypothetical protein
VVCIIYRIIYRTVYHCNLNLHTIYTAFLMRLPMYCFFTDRQYLLKINKIICWQCCKCYYYYYYGRWLSLRHLTFVFSWWSLFNEKISHYFGWLIKVKAVSLKKKKKKIILSSTVLCIEVICTEYIKIVFVADSTILLVQSTKLQNWGCCRSSLWPGGLKESLSRTSVS